MKKTPKQRSQKQPQEDLELTEEQAAAVSAGEDVAPRPYVAVSNILKTKHDTAKNSISNVR